MSNEKTIGSLSRNFVIPAGTQVVINTLLRIVEFEEDSNHHLSKSDTKPTFKKSGSVGVVVKCPPHNSLPYTIRFTDGAIASATFDEVVLRRQEIDNLLRDKEFDLRDCVIYRCKVGSKAFGLSTESSDDDLRGVFLPPAEKHWSLYKLPEQIESKDGDLDEVYWELEKFLRLALKANPNILETLWTPLVMHASPLGEKLLEIRSAFLSKHIYKTYSGYVLSQFRRMKNSVEKTGKYKPKHAMHLLRLLYSGIHALEHGQIMIDVSEHRNYLLEVRSGAFEFEKVRQSALELDRVFQVAFEKTNLPDQPNFELVNQFLIEARRSVVKERSNGNE